MNERQLLAIQNFAACVSELRAAEVIRSHRYLGDIAEFLCAAVCGIDLSKNLREVGHDGLRGNVKVQIKYNGGEKRNVDLGDPSSYEEIYIVLGKASYLRTTSHKEDFLVYRLSSEEVHIMRTKSGRYSCGRGQLPKEPLHCISLSVAGDA